MAAIAEMTAGSDGAPFLELEGIVKRFGSFEALKSVDLSIAEGEFLTLLGPSGCGKSTLLRLICGFEPATAGSVRLRGKDLSGVPPERLPFNMVFQSYALFPHMSVAANVGYGPRTAGVSSSEVAGRVKEMLALVHLGDHADRSVTELSGGQRQRVALARALVNEPEVLLLDEPLGALDLQLRKRLQDELRQIQQRLRTTFIYVTHDQEEALTLSDRIAVMNAGCLMQLASPREIYEHPTSRFVAEFVGEANLLDCDVVAADGKVVNVRFANGHSASLEQAGLGLAPGAPALVMVRPQHLAVGDPGQCAFEGRIDRTVFLGSHVRHDVKLENGTVLRVHVDPAGARSDGDLVGLDMRPGHGAVVPAEAHQA